MLKEALEQTGVAGLIGWNEQNNDEERIIQRAWATALYPFQLAVSPPAIKVYLTLLLFLTTSFVLISISTTAFGIFYYKYIPQTSLERPVYLQYGADTYPKADVSLGSNELISQQPYDVSVILHMPRDPVNLAAGNFMLDLTLHGNVDGLEASVLKSLNMEDHVPSSTLHRSRRPALMPYASATSDLISKVVHLPLHLLSYHDFDSVVLTVPMFEKVEFARGRDNIPKTATLEIQSQRPPQPLLPLGQKDALPIPQLHVYSAKLIFQVQFHGLRYLIYNHRILAFAIFTTLFYTVSVSTLAVVWAALATVFRTVDDKSLIKLEKEKRIKQEPGHDTSDPLRTASDYKSDKPLRLRGTDDSENEAISLKEGRSRLDQVTPQTSEQASAASQEQMVKEEGDEAEAEAAPEEQADDEDEQSEDEWQQLERLRRRMEHDARQRQLAMQQQDSGLGTSLESENAAARSGLARRSSSRKGSSKE